MSRIILFLFTFVFFAHCKKTITTPQLENIPKNMKATTVLPAIKPPQHTGSFSLSADPLGNDTIKHFGVKIAVTLPPDADFFEVAICDKAHPTICSPTKDAPAIFSGNTPITIPNPLGVNRATTADLNVSIRVCKAQSPFSQPGSLQTALVCAEWQPYTAYQLQPTSDAATAALYEDAYQKQQALLAATYNWQVSLADVSSTMKAQSPKGAGLGLADDSTGSGTAATENATQAVAQQTSDIANGSTGNLAETLGDPTQADDIASTYQGATVNALNQYPSCAEDLTKYPNATQCVDAGGQLVQIAQITGPNQKCDPTTGLCPDPVETNSTTSTATSSDEGVLFLGSVLAVVGVSVMAVMGKSFLGKMNAYRGKSVPLKESVPLNIAEPVSTNATIKKISKGSEVSYQIVEQKTELITKNVRPVSGTMDRLVTKGETYTVVRNGAIGADGKFSVRQDAGGIEIRKANGTEYTFEEGIRMTPENIPFSQKLQKFSEAAIKENIAFEERANLHIKATSSSKIIKAGIGVGIGIAAFVGGVVLAVCGGADLCLADTNTLPTKITTSNDRLQAMLQASDDFRFSMHALAQTLYPTAAATTP